MNFHSRLWHGYTRTGLNSSFLWNYFSLNFQTSTSFNTWCLNLQQKLTIFHCTNTLSKCEHGNWIKIWLLFLVCKHFILLLKSNQEVMCPLFHLLHDTYLKVFGIFKMHSCSKYWSLDKRDGYYIFGFTPDTGLFHTFAHYMLQYSTDGIKEFFRFYSWPHCPSLPVIYLTFAQYNIILCNIKL